MHSENRTDIIDIQISDVDVPKLRYRKAVQFIGSIELICCTFILVATVPHFFGEGKARYGSRRGIDPLKNFSNSATIIHFSLMLVKLIAAKLLVLSSSKKAVS